MTQDEITDKRLRRIHARIRHLNALLSLRAIRGSGGGADYRRSERAPGRNERAPERSGRRKEGHGETGRMWSVDRTIILVTGSAGYQPRHGKKAGGSSGR
jgi:hypothetical protein